MSAPLLAAPLLPELAATIATATVAFACLIIFAGTIGSLRAGRHTGVLLATYLGVGLEFLLAAGLIRLASAETFAMLGLAGAILLVRRTIVLGLRYAARATG